MNPYWTDGKATLYHGDCLAVLRNLPSESVQCCVSSPPYFGLRSYLPDAVKIRDDLSDDDRAFIESEMKKLGILPIYEG